MSKIKYIKIQYKKGKDFIKFCYFIVLKHLKRFLNTYRTNRNWVFVKPPPLVAMLIIRTVIAFLSYIVPSREVARFDYHITS